MVTLLRFHFVILVENPASENLTYALYGNRHDKYWEIISNCEIGVINNFYNLSFSPKNKGFFYVAIPIYIQVWQIAFAGDTYT